MTDLRIYKPNDAVAGRKWCAVLNRTGEAWDYGSLRHLKAEAKRHRLTFTVEALLATQPGAGKERAE